ncbi:hypothetical protein C8J57DRAFT_1611219 [Mycena rebaudengoi]|nr:hypothetical protein C8J57DRAFT_1611219 [Mycena rebaudengoi]
MARINKLYCANIVEQRPSLRENWLAGARSPASAVNGGPQLSGEWEKVRTEQRFDARYIMTDLNIQDEVAIRLIERKYRSLGKIFMFVNEGRHESVDSELRNAYNECGNRLVVVQEKSGRWGWYIKLKPHFSPPVVSRAVTFASGMRRKKLGDPALLQDNDVQRKLAGVAFGVHEGVGWSVEGGGARLTEGRSTRAGGCRGGVGEQDLKEREDAVEQVYSACNHCGENNPQISPSLRGIARTGGELRDSGRENHSASVAIKL